MIKRHILPASGIMARFASRSELAIMRVLRGMTCKAILRRTLIDSVHMTRSALNIRVQSNQREGSLTMIETYILPAGGIMA